jgi:hypothetical protein
MKSFRSSAGPFAERPYYEDEEIERICTQELRAVGLYPPTPEPIRIERFIEKRFGVPVEYDDVPPGTLGYTRFGRTGVVAVVVSRALAEDGGAVSERRLNTTLAHEAGHGLLHGYLFVLGEVPASLLSADGPQDASRILCREDAVPTRPGSGVRRYDGRWWEFQANKAMGALLLPKLLVEASLEGVLQRSAGLRLPTLPEAAREEAIQRVAAVFDVNAVVARIRLGDMFPGAGSQLPL